MNMLEELDNMLEDLEPSDAELNLIDDGSEPDMDDGFVDSLLYIENGLIIMTRVVGIDPEGKVFMFKPTQLEHGEGGNIHLRPFMPETDDEFITLNSHLEGWRVISRATPKRDILEAYHAFAEVNQDEYVPAGAVVH